METGSARFGRSFPSTGNSPEWACPQPKDVFAPLVEKERGPREEFVPRQSPPTETSRGRCLLLHPAGSSGYQGFSTSEAQALAYPALQKTLREYPGVPHHALGVPRKYPRAGVWRFPPIDGSTEPGLPVPASP